MLEDMEILGMFILQFSADEYKIGQLPEATETWVW